MDIYEKILTELKGIKTELAILNKSNSDKLDSAKDNMIQSVEGMMSERLSKVKAQKAYQEGYSMAIDIISKEFQYELNEYRKLMYEFANGVITAQIELNEKCKTCLDGANFKNCEKCSVGKAKETLSKIKGDAKIIVKYEKPEIIGTDGKVNKCSGGLSFTFKPVGSAAAEIENGKLKSTLRDLWNETKDCGYFYRSYKDEIKELLGEEFTDLDSAAIEEGDENDK